jgi:NAD(P)-dependent dehydrogenase (short-subunit alcohol dehydrogenase family)
MQALRQPTHGLSTSGRSLTHHGRPLADSPTRHEAVDDVRIGCRKSFDRIGRFRSKQKNGAIWRIGQCPAENQFSSLVCRSRFGKMRFSEWLTLGDKVVDDVIEQQEVFHVTCSTEVSSNHNIATMHRQPMHSPALDEGRGRGGKRTDGSVHLLEGVVRVSVESRVVIVTGSGGVGCGRAIAMRFATDGHSVVVTDINAEGGTETVQHIERSGGRAAFIRADIRDDRDASDLISFAERTFGSVDVLVNNASSPHHGEEIEHWMGPLETDLLGTLRVTRWAVDAMRRGAGGAIVNISSISAVWHGRTTGGGFAGYDVAKAAMIRMTTRLDTLAAKDGIRVNCLAPGWIGTPEVRGYWESLTPAERGARGVPSRLLSPDQVADAVVRIAGDRSLSGRVIEWWSERAPRLIEWGDRGYRNFADVSWGGKGAVT